MMKKLDVTVLVKVWPQIENSSLCPNDELQKIGQGRPTVGLMKQSVKQDVKQERQHVMSLEVLCKLLKHDALQQIGDEREVRNGSVVPQLIWI